MSRLSTLLCDGAPFAAAAPPDDGPGNTSDAALSMFPFCIIISLVLAVLPTGLGPNQDFSKESPDGVDTLEEASMSLSCFLHVLYPFVLYVALALEVAIFELFVPVCLYFIGPLAYSSIRCKLDSWCFLSPGSFCEDFSGFSASARRRNRLRYARYRNDVGTLLGEEGR